eukprot:gene10567-22054_t
MISTLLLIIFSVFPSVCAYHHLNYRKFSPKYRLKSIFSEVKKQSPVIPTLKGVETKINTIVPVHNIEAVRVRHIALATEELANSCHAMIKEGSAEFSKLAETLSMCESSKSKGGEVGWVSSSNDIESTLLPLEIINIAYKLNKGDMIVISGIGNTGLKTWHVLQLMDVSTKLNKSLSKRRSENYLSLKGLQSGASLTYSMETMGCQMNFADSERIEGQLIELGYIKVQDTESPNLVILNTCSIRDHAEQKVYSYIGPHALRKRKGMDVSIVVTGCVAQQEGELLTRRFPEVDVVMGPQYSNRIGDILEAVADGYQVVVTDPTYQSEDLTLPNRKSSVTAWVNVVYGCNERCTYCVVPTTRGVEQSRTKEAILTEVRQLVTDGFREITLLGQNIDAWGR